MSTISKDWNAHDTYIIAFFLILITCFCYGARISRLHRFSKFVKSPCFVHALECRTIVWRRQVKCWLFLYDRRTLMFVFVSSILNSLWTCVRIFLIDVPINVFFFFRNLFIVAFYFSMSGLWGLLLMGIYLTRKNRVLVQTNTHGHYLRYSRNINCLKNHFCLWNSMKSDLTEIDVHSKSREKK